ncbi:hypothetical protein ACHWQZ_G005420 [Mnemiopsis leidyi]
MLRQHAENNQFCLSIPKTTIGTKDCELVIQGPDVAPQHLTIEKRNGAEYILHDLGTSEGTLVNHCRVSGASVKLNCGDIIKLGPNSPAFTFISPGLSPPSIITELRPSSAPISKAEPPEISGPRTHSAILTGRSTMKRNTLNGSVQNGNHHSDHDSYEKQEILEMLQRTVVAQEKRLTEMADDIRHFKSIEQLTSKNGREKESATERNALFRLEKQRSETQAANNVMASLQNELLEKTRREETLVKEVEDLQREKLGGSGTVVALRRQLAEKEAELRQLRGEYNAFKVRPDELKEQNIIFTKENKNLRKQIRDAKRQVQENQDKVIHLEKDLAEVQGKLAHETRMHITSRDMVTRLQGEVADKAKLERLLKIEAKESEVKLKHFEASVREALSKLSDSEPSETDDVLVSKIEDLVKSHIETSSSLEKREEELAASRKSYNNIHENLAKIELEALTLLEVVQSSEGGISGKVEKEGDKIAALEISENLLWLQGMVLTLARAVEKYSSELEKKTASAASAAKATGLSADLESTGVEELIETLKATTLRLKTEKQELEEKLTNTVDNYEAKLAALHRKHTDSLREETETLKRLHEEQMRGLYVSEQQKQSELRGEYTAQVAILKENVSDLESQIQKHKAKEEESSTKQSELEARIEELVKSEKTSRMMEESLREKISKFDSDTLAIRQTVVDQKERVAAAEQEAESLREQNRQYAVTIVTMENKLHSMSSRCNDMELELNDSLSKLEAVPPPPPEPYSVLKCRENEMHREIQRLTTLSNTLRREFGLAKAEADQRAVQIQGLRCDLAGAAARLSDMSGELSESQKIERENLIEQAARQVKQLEIQRETIDLLTLELETVKGKLRNVPEKLPKKTPPKVKIEYREREMTEEEKDSVEQGKKCVDERHGIIIDKQRLALAEFRAQLKAKSPTIIEPTVEGSQQIIRLKKELNELRAALKNKDLEYASKENDLKTKARQLNSTTEKNADIVKHVKSELNDSNRLLGHSEACFSALATEVRSALNQPQNPIAQLTIDKLEHGLKDRALMTADIGAQIVAITTRLSQKDVLLSTYQDDLSVLRKTEEEAGEAGLEVSVLKKKLSSLEQESSNLKRSLTHVQGELDQQQRLNHALAQRNVNREVSSEPALQHQCPDPRTESQIELLKKQHQEEIKRKNYDIKKLKEELIAS